MSNNRATPSSEHQRDGSPEIAVSVAYAIQEYDHTQNTSNTTARERIASRQKSAEVISSVISPIRNHAPPVGGCNHATIRKGIRASATPTRRRSTKRSRTKAWSATRQEDIRIKGIRARPRRCRGRRSSSTHGNTQHTSRKDQRNRRHSAAHQTTRPSQNRRNETPR
jgi:hypothetical protein